jgi:hypothetical protein
LITSLTPLKCNGKDMITNPQDKTSPETRWPQGTPTGDPKHSFYGTFPQVLVKCETSPGVSCRPESCVDLVQSAVTAFGSTNEKGQHVTPENVTKEHMQRAKGTCTVGTCSGTTCSGDNDCRGHRLTGANGGFCIGKPGHEGICSCYGGYACANCKMGLVEDLAKGAKCGDFEYGGAPCSTDRDCQYKGPIGKEPKQCGSGKCGGLCKNSVCTCYNDKSDKYACADCSRSVEDLKSGRATCTCSQPRLSFMVSDGNTTYADTGDTTENDGAVMCVDTARGSVFARIKNPNPKCSTFYTITHFTGYTYDPDTPKRIASCNATGAVKVCKPKDPEENTPQVCEYKAYPWLYSDVYIMDAQGANGPRCVLRRPLLLRSRPLLFSPVLTLSCHSLPFFSPLSATAIVTAGTVVVVNSILHSKRTRLRVPRVTLFTRKSHRLRRSKNSTSSTRIRKTQQ